MAPARRHEDRSAAPRRLLLQGIAESHRGEFKALQTLGVALAKVQAQDDREGAVLAAAALLVTAQTMSSFRRLAEFVEAVAPLACSDVTFAEPSDELLAQTGLLSGLLMLRPGDAAITPCVARIMVLLEHEVDVNVRFAAGRLVLFYADPREAREMGQRVFALLQASMDDPALTPHRLGRWLALWARCASDAKDRVQAERARAQALALVERHRDKDTVFFLTVGEFDAAVHARDMPGMEAAVARAAGVADPANLNDLGRVEWFKGRLALAKRDGDAALFHARRSRKFCEELETPGPMLAVRVALEGQALLLVHDFAGARVAFARTAGLAAVLHKDEMYDMIRMVDAYEALVLRKPDARALLAHAFAAPRARQYAIGRRILSCYRGAYLANEEAQRWILAARDRWHHRFLRCMADAGLYWERRQAWVEAVRFYERGIEVDTLSEDLYRRLMRCHLAQGQPAEAARVYRRCREMLSVQLGISPSPDTETLFQSIYGR